jgi:soluble lytic murein transglycosylase
VFRISAILFAFGLIVGAAHAEDKRSPFAQGVEFYQAGKYDKAEPLLRKAGDSAGALGLYQKYFLADTLMQLNKVAEAEPILKGLLIQKPSSELKYRAMFLLSQTAIAKGQWKDAKVRLQPLARKWRHSPEYAQVLHRLMRVDLKLHNQGQACKWAKKLYSRFPTDALVSSWTSNLQEMVVDGQKIGCPFRMSDFQERVRHLEWAGEAERARKEIEEVRARVSPDEKGNVDVMMARFLISEGLVEDALALLVRNYPEQKNNFDYLMLLGVAGARAGEYQTAVGAFDKANAMSPHSKRGREALFQAAFLSYQFQDYDGAVKKFSQLVGTNPRSGLARDAQWHLAWLQYLRGDFEGALKKMADVRNSNMRSKRFRNSTSDQRLLYWMAMSQLRLNNLAEAKAGFAGIVHDTPYTYYALAAQARLTQLSKDTTVARDTSSTQAKPTDAAKPAVVATNDDEENESEEEITKSETAPPEPEGDEKEASVDTEPLDSSEFKEPALKAHLEAAKELTALNFTDLARFELFEVERRTSNPTYLKLLISAYEAINSYHRSASISELSFAADRIHGGVDGSRALWVSAFPQAYKKLVQRAASAQQVPEEWVWGIMRAESMYKTDVISPVGAKGLMQLMPSTSKNLARLGDVKDFKVDDLLEPKVNIPLGAQYLARLGRQLHGNLSLVAAAYNAGPHRVQGWLVSFGHLETDEFIEHIPFVETRNYVKKVLLNDWSYRMIYAKDQTPFKWLSEPLGVAIPSKIPTHESWDTI